MKKNRLIKFWQRKNYDLPDVWRFDLFKNMKCNGVLTKCEELDLDNKYF